MKIDNSVDPKRAAVTAAVMFVLVTSFVMGMSSPLASQGARGIGGIEGNADSAYEIGLWGDLPYSDVQALTGVPNLIADMNSQQLTFTVQDGDFKAGNGTPGSVTPTTCTDALYLQGLNYLNALKGPAMFTPGDNDWTDCDRPANGGFSSRERLDHERLLFFSTPYSLGQNPVRQEVQETPLCLGVSGPVPCVENRRWNLGGVLPWRL